MPKLSPVDWKTLIKVFEHYGFHYERTKGDHLIYSKNGILRPIVIPKYKEIDTEIIARNLRTAGLSREEYFSALKES